MMNNKFTKKYKLKKSKTNNRYRLKKKIIIKLFLILNLLKNKVIIFKINKFLNLFYFIKIFR